MGHPAWCTVEQQSVRATCRAEAGASGWLARVLPLQPFSRKEISHALLNTEQGFL